MRNIEIIGEAVSHIDRMSPDFIAQHPELPWRNIHAYFNVDLATVWRTVQDDLPRLKQQVDQLLQQQPSREPDSSEAARGRS